MSEVKTDKILILILRKKTNMTVNKIKNIFNNATLTTKSAFNTASSSVRSAGKTHIINT